MHSKELENIFEYGSTISDTNYNDPILVPVTELRTTSLSTQTFLPSIPTTLLDKTTPSIQTSELMTYTATVPTTTATKISPSYGSSSDNHSVMRASIPKKQIVKDYDQSSFVNSEAVSSESVSSSSEQSPKKKLPSRTVNMVELSYGDFQVLQFPYVDLTWDEAKNFCDNIGMEFHQSFCFHVKFLFKTLKRWSLTLFQY